MIGLTKILYTTTIFSPYLIKFNTKGVEIVHMDIITQDKTMYLTLMITFSKLLN